MCITFGDLILRYSPSHFLDMSYVLFVLKNEVGSFFILVEMETITDENNRDLPAGSYGILCCRSSCDD